MGVLPVVKKERKQEKIWVNMWKNVYCLFALVIPIRFTWGAGIIA